MKARFSVFFIVLLSNVACSQNRTDFLEGTWVLKEVNSQPIYECADVIVFEENKSYMILNDCYGLDAREPAIEKGTWEYNSDRMLITLSARDFLLDFNDYMYRSDAPRLVVEIREIDGNTIVICFDARLECQEEKYSKMLE
jgi:hypothetical protein